MATIASKKLKKRWVSIYSQRQFFKGQEIGETFTSDPTATVGKVLNINLMNLTGDPKKQSFNARFKVTGSEEGKAVADFIGYQMGTSQIKRLVRKATNKIEDSFDVETKDKVKLKIKPLLLTRNLAHNSVLTSLRKQTREFVANRFKETDYSSIVSEIISGKLQKDIKLTLKKTYPINIVEIKTLKKL
ncbi:MAG: hypothetical protein Q8R00_04045 [Candidatus Nanoarchaeia archaeon]|nr:hypothetical protein [Candidatus Nanoarchaeia archaeon]